VLGGAFNPPHLGHLVLAQEAYAVLGLAEVVLMPTGRAPHKEIEDDPGADVRLDLTRVAAEGDERLSVSELETGRDEPSFTYRTLELVREERPGEDLFLLMGADAAAGLESWRSPQRILELATLGIAERRGVERSAVEGVLARLGAGHARFLDMPRIEVSSTMVRERVGGGRPIRYLVPESVAELIAERALYGDATSGDRPRGLQQA
jgi:nicotinate-nucleotide adenylyltransferase